MKTRNAARPKLLTVDGIEVLVTKKAIKNMHLYVKPPDGRAEVSAPLRMPDAQIEAFVRSKIGWIKWHREAFAQRPPKAERAYVSGETLYIWGAEYALLVRYAVRGSSLVLDGNRAILTVREQSTPQQRERVVNEWYRAILKAEIERLLPKWEEITGLHPSGWQVKNMKSRWGSCNVSTRKIWLSLQLAKRAPVCLEYVLVHELVHLAEKSHNARFRAYMDRFMPDWRIIRERLNRQIPA